MKAKIIPIIVVLVTFSAFFNGCEDTTYKEYKGYAPVYMSYKDLRSAVTEVQDSELKNPGKIYFKDNYIFIVEELEGIHVYDNTVPSSPVKKGFVKLPGVVDISVSGSYLYADSYIDLVVLDIQDVENIHEVGRVNETFPYTVPSTNTDYPMTRVDKDKGVVIKWELRTIKERVDNNVTPYPVYYLNSFGYMDKINAAGASSGVSGSGIGIGGSMARFGIKGKNLYVLDQTLLKVFDLSNPLLPLKVNELYPGWNVETMFLKGNEMFLGTTTGMAILDISSPAAPVSETFFTHARSCDPVIVDDTLAYVTLRSGSSCGGMQNLLDIVNIRDIKNPKSVISYSMTDPHGLAKSGNLLFVCDGIAGLKVYDAANPRLLSGNLIYSYPGIQAFDVIPIGNVLVMIGGDGLYQYSYSDVKNITLLSTIPVIK